MTWESQIHCKYWRWIIKSWLNKQLKILRMGPFGDHSAVTLGEKLHGHCWCFHGHRAVRVSGVKLWIYSWNGRPFSDAAEGTDCMVTFEVFWDRALLVSRVMPWRLSWNGRLIDDDTGWRDCTVIMSGCWVMTWLGGETNWLLFWSSMSESLEIYSGHGYEMAVPL